jgi:hypothetical protein
MFTKEGELLSASGFLRLKATAYFELDWWPAIIAKFQGLISIKVLPFSLAMLAFVLSLLQRLCGDFKHQ